MDHSFLVLFFPFPPNNGHHPIVPKTHCDERWSPYDHHVPFLSVGDERRKTLVTIFHQQKVEVRKRGRRKRRWKESWLAISDHIFHVNKIRFLKSYENEYYFWMTPTKIICPANKAYGENTKRSLTKGQIRIGNLFTEEYRRQDSSSFVCCQLFAIYRPTIVKQTKSLPTTMRTWMKSFQIEMRQNCKHFNFESWPIGNSFSFAKPTDEICSL